MSGNRWVLLQAFLAGTLAVISLAPFDFYVAAVVSVSWFFCLLEKNERGCFWLGFCYGLGYFLAGVYWIAISLLVDAEQFAWLIPFAVTLIPGVLALYFAGLGYFYGRFGFRIEAFWLRVLFFAFLWLVFELLRGVLFTGFPWNLFGYNLMFSDYSSQFASIIGVYGLSFFSVLFCLSLVLLFDKNRESRWFFWVILVIFAGNFAFGYLRIASTPLDISLDKMRLVQGNIEQKIKWNPEKKYYNLMKQIAISKMSGFKDVKAVIWSETAVPYAIGVDGHLTKKLTEAVADDGFLVTGALRLEFDDDGAVKRAYNSVFAIDKNGMKKHYDKHHLVPFGEYIPLARFLPFLTKITGEGVGFGEGDGPETLEMKGLKISPLLCYEVIFSSKVLDRKNRPDLLVNVTNDAWFGRSSGPYQHFNMARMRAIEYGVSLARVANTGITAYVDVFGRMVKKIDLGEEGFVDVKLIKPLAETFYSQFKNIMLLLVLGIGGVVAFLLKNTKKK